MTQLGDPPIHPLVSDQCTTITGLKVTYVWRLCLYDKSHIWNIQTSGCHIGCNKDSERTIFEALKIKEKITVVILLDNWMFIGQTALHLYSGPTHWPEKSLSHFMTCALCCTEGVGGILQQGYPLLYRKNL